MKRFLMLLLACAMFLVCLAGCGGGKKDPVVDSTDTTAVQNNDEDNPGYDANGYLLDDLPDDLDFSLYNDGKITILYWNNGELGSGEFDPEEDAGSSIEKAVYARNKKTEDRLRVELVWQGIPGKWEDKETFLSKVTTASMGGDAARYDLIGGYSQNMATLASRGFTLDLITASKYLNLQKPWWPDSLVNDMTISDKLYFASGDISISFLGTMLSVFVNKQAYPNQNLYDLVYDGDWTLETMFEMIKDKREDNGEPAKKDLEDKFGLIVAWNGYFDGFFYGSDLITAEHDSVDGSLRVGEGYVGEKADTLCEQLKTLFKSDDAWLPLESDSVRVGAVNLFAHGNAAMMLGTGTTILVYPEMIQTDVNYAILPMPKYNEEQETYKSVNLNIYTLWSIFSNSTSEQAERAGAVMECLASEGFRKVTPVLFDTCLKSRYAKDGDTGKMYDIIRAGIVFDPGRVFSTGALGGIPQDAWQQSVIYNRSWGAQTAQVDSKLQDKLDELCEKFKSNEN